ncbi:tRNA pseudouridine(38-40) synthase TruA [Flavobacterium antarcticum]|uniref:tRNA pseudouridine(38-40) synthase TruA n=1 Tax=Flavobacterium antarcticum TaxID=271155 RepID=UPI0003B3BD6F|nr:tRNA pseudouridine(38-40) synthase TruA [Flavobacterium antarcticum]
MRFFIQLSYNGTNYHGWQIQPNATSVQETLTKALGVVLNDKNIAIMGAGRTDTGVHASQMFAHFDYENEIDSKTIVHKLNSFLPKDIAVSNIILVDENAHARFDAKQRTYEYKINLSKNVFLDELSWYYNKKLNVEAMNDAASLLMKHNDFQCFSKVHTDVNTFNCKITKAFWKEEDDQLTFTISADRFLRNMVRSIVGTLVYVGLGKISKADFQIIIESKDRKKAGFSVPACGLYLTEIKYDYIELL